jgi:hypothetical protein
VVYDRRAQRGYPEAPRSLTVKPKDGKVAACSVSITVQGLGQAEVTK